MQPRNQARPLATLALAALSWPAAAQERPSLLPTRDVSVTYRADGSGRGPVEMRLSWLNAEETMRMDLPGGAGWSLTDMRDGRVRMVIEAQRVVMELPPGSTGRNPAQPSASTRFRRIGSETILGHRCDVWHFEDGEQRGEACITADGVMLRAQGNSQGQQGQLVQNR